MPMLFMVKMRVDLPPEIDPTLAQSLGSAEAEMARVLQHGGEWRHLWRLVGMRESLSIFDVSSNDRLHTILASLPLHKYMAIEVRPLATHPAAIEL
jgi:muconolactone D-isomerase